MFKNVASQKIALFVYDSTTGAPKTGDSANLTPYVSKDYGTVTVLGTVTATEMDATNAKGWYSFVLTQAETNADTLIFSGKSSTANIYAIGQLIYTDPPNYSTLSVDGSGRVDVIKIAGTSQTARDIGASVIAASVTARVTANTDQFNGDATGAANIAKTTRAIVRATASGVPTTTSIPTSACTPAGAVADQFKGRIITFDADTASTALRGQATDITASSNAAAPVFTVTALTTAPVSGDTFSIT